MGYLGQGEVYIHIYTQLEELLYLRFETKNFKRKIEGCDPTYGILFILEKASKCLKARKLN